MNFAWPWMLLSLTGVPLLVVAYRRLLARRAQRRATLGALGLIASGTTDRRRERRRHTGPALQLAALAVLAVALARPEATVAEPRREGTVVLAVDVSGSMAADDVQPTRLEAARRAARAFVARQPPTVQVGVVAFGSTGLVVQRPTSDRTAVLAAVDRLRPAGGTALGRGLQTALGLAVGRPVRLPSADGTDATDATGDPLEPAGQDLGYHSSAAVVLLSDGENRSDPDPLEVARLASTAGVRVYAVGLGSPQGTVLQIDGFRVSTRLDEAQLRAVASTTGGTYYAAPDAASLAAVYERIAPIWTVQARRQEVTGLFAAAAAVLLLAGAALSFVRFGRVI